MWGQDDHRKAKYAEAIRAYVERDTKHDGLARAIFRCHLISAGLKPHEIESAIAEKGMERRNKALPPGVVPLR